MAEHLTFCDAYYISITIWAHRFSFCVYFYCLMKTLFPYNSVRKKYHLIKAYLCVRISCLISISLCLLNLYTLFSSHGYCVLPHDIPSIYHCVHVTDTYFNYKNYENKFSEESLNSHTIFILTLVIFFL